MTTKYILADVIHNGSCCRKGGGVELVETIKAGQIPNADNIALVYPPDGKTAKAHNWACQPFKGVRLILKYLDGDKANTHFILDGKFSSFLRSETVKTVNQPKAYSDLVPIDVGQIWELRDQNGAPYKVMVRAEGRGDGGTVFLSHLATKDEEEVWIPSDFPIPTRSLRASLLSYEGKLLGVAAAA